MNWAQIDLFQEMHYLNIILKARQLGFTTFIDIFILDMCLFNSNISAGIIADTKLNAGKIFESKIKYVYENLPLELQAAIPRIVSSKSEVVFGNGSSIFVSTSLRSGTYQILHVSEMGKIAVKFPEKAREIVTGAFNAVAEGQMVFVESTAEGKGGRFHSLVKQAQLNMKLPKLSPQEFKFHFYPWWKNPLYATQWETHLTWEETKYFMDLKEKGIDLSDQQKWWYAKKKRVMELENDPESSGDMFREFPSTPEEAFQSSVEGAVYKNEIAQIIKEKRVLLCPYDPRYPVTTAWDIGYRDATAVWFVQFDGIRHRFIDYYESTRTSLKDDIKAVLEKPYLYAEHIGPHDLNKHEKFNGVTLYEQALDLGFTFKVLEQSGVLAGVNKVRMILPIAVFDEQKTKKGFEYMETYSYEWDDKIGDWKKDALHDKSSHGADAMRYYAVGFDAGSYYANTESVGGITEFDPYELN
jgi:hypothetical protein